jgi:hypothetical protein
MILAGNGRSPARHHGGGTDQRAEQARVVALLRMPLNPDRESGCPGRPRPIRELQCLHGPVRRPRGGGQSRTEPVDRLMVMRGDLDPVPVPGRPVETARPGTVRPSPARPGTI